MTTCSAVHFFFVGEIEGCWINNSVVVCEEEGDIEIPEIKWDVECFAMSFIEFQGRHHTGYYFGGTVINC